MITNSSRQITVQQLRKSTADQEGRRVEQFWTTPHQDCILAEHRVIISRFKVREILEESIARKLADGLIRTINSKVQAP